MRSTLFLIGLLVVVSPSDAKAAAENKTARFNHFHQKVLPLLKAKCFQCHGAEKQEGGLRLDSAEAMLKGGDSGPAVVSGDPEESLIVEAIRQTDDLLKMPPKDELQESEIQALVKWVKDGLLWPRPAMVLFEDEVDILNVMAEGEGKTRMDDEDRFSGQVAFVVSSSQRQSPRITGWNFPVREHPGPGQYRFIRFAWKKRSGGAILFKVANDGQWGSHDVAAGTWIAGKNTTGSAAISLADVAPNQWTVVTRDLWTEGWKDFTLTGISLSAIDGGEALLDAVVLGPTIDSLDAYAPGRDELALKPNVKQIGDAWSDPENPVFKTFGGQRLDLWSLKKPVRVEPPQVKESTWPKTPVDNFILAKLEEHGLTPSPQADRRTLIRRLYFTLIGMPPSPAESRAFFTDSSPAAYEHLVDRLLASPRYGERWARRWLDVVRYSDSDGFEEDPFRPQMWRFRDYVIRSLNQDKPFDQFVREQIAGDEMVTNDPADRQQDLEKLIATGFLRLGPYDNFSKAFGEAEVSRDQLMADLANTTGSAFLGLTMNCCRCHDHKYEPLLQADHFRLRAFFAGVKFRDDIIVDSANIQEQIKQHNAPLEKQISEVQAQASKMVADSQQRLHEQRLAELSPEIRKLLDIPPEKRDLAAQRILRPVQDHLAVRPSEGRAAFTKEQKKRHGELTAKVGQLEGRKRSLNTIMSMCDAGPNPHPTRIFFQGDPKDPRDEVSPGFLSVLDPNPAKITGPKSDTTSGRRTTLANWIVSADNPLTARVLVNRLWHYHFGRGIVETPNDFGLTGARPTHPQLLDWLATEFIRQGWSIKQIHRTILLSATFQQTSVEDSQRASIDPDNKLLWRRNIRRLDAETLRDSILAVSGQLLSTDSGRPVWPLVPKEVLNSLAIIFSGRENRGWYTDSADKTSVRSIFLVQKRSMPVPFIQAFDLPDMSVSCGRRNVTTVAPQALMLLNDPLVVKTAKTFAKRVSLKGDPEPARQIQRAFWLALSRGPTREELSTATEMLARHTKLHKQRLEEAKSPKPQQLAQAATNNTTATTENTAAKKTSQFLEAAEQAALTDLCHALLNVNEFIFVD